MNKNLAFLLFIISIIGLFFFYQINQIQSPISTKLLGLQQNIFCPQNETKPDPLVSKPSIFCLIKTHPDNIRIKKALNVYNVWGRKCDNYRFVTMIPKEFLPQNLNTAETFEIYNEFYMIQPKSLVVETHDRLSLKVYYAMLYVYEKLPSYDWYHIVDDDAYVNMENFKAFLSDKDHKQPVTFGFNINLYMAQGYHSGGPGYVLSNEAFTRVGKALKENIKNCPDSGIDDVDINACVRKYGGNVGKSADDQGRERFLVMSLKTHLKGDYPNWLFQHSGNKIKKGIDCCADSLIAVHYMQAKDVFRLDLAMETHKKYINEYNRNTNISLSVRFRDIARIYLMLEDMETGSKEYETYMNFST